MAEESLLSPSKRQRLADEEDEDDDIPHLTLPPDGSEGTRLRRQFELLCGDHRPEFRRQKKKRILELYELVYWVLHNRDPGAKDYLKDPRHRGQDHAVEIYQRAEAATATEKDIGVLCDAIFSFLKGSLQDLPAEILQLLMEQLSLGQFDALSRASPLLHGILPSVDSRVVQYYRSLAETTLNITPESFREALAPSSIHRPLLRKCLFSIQCLLTTDLGHWVNGQWKGAPISAANDPLQNQREAAVPRRVVWEDIHAAVSHIPPEAIKIETLEDDEEDELQRTVIELPPSAATLLILQDSLASGFHNDDDLYLVDRFVDAGLTVRGDWGRSTEFTVLSLQQDMQRLWQASNVPMNPRDIVRDILLPWTFIQQTRKQFPWGAYHSHFQDSIFLGLFPASQKLHVLGPVAYPGPQNRPLSVRQGWSMMHLSPIQLLPIVQHMIGADQRDILIPTLAMLLTTPTAVAAFRSYGPVGRHRSHGNIVLRRYEFSVGVAQYPDMYWGNVALPVSNAFIVMAYLYYTLTVAPSLSLEERLMWKVHCFVTFTDPL